MLCDCFEKGERNDYCRGTRDKEWCRCGGDKSKCDYYELVRARANGELIRSLERAFQRIVNTNAMPYSDMLTLNIALEELNRQKAEIDELKAKLREFVEKLRGICEEGKDG